ncbi:MULTISPECIES: hypothetical protein [Exiguobacterium]|uniref:DUF4340 domain-containing protein n=1 Tax=Exiguobacterium alkaliphilum TaxID=1428684 RepID=A0ABT2KZF9_9BACL|nr:hypothetical protein [Exiguobacterium alkaliphilum]MCT4796302.1 hypothetical protein [Exiguobacterium alkaliphilum]
MNYERKKRHDRKRRLRIGLLSATVFLVAAGLIYFLGYQPAAENERIHVRFKEALLTEDVGFFEQNVEYANEPLTRAETLRFIRWLNDEPSIRSEAIAEVVTDREDAAASGDGLFRLIDTGEGRFGFSDYRIELLPKQLTVTTDVPYTNVWVDGIQAARLEEAGETVTLDRMPGRYDVKAVAVVDGTTRTQEETVTLVDVDELAFSLRPETSEVIAGQFDLDRTELIEIEVEAQTGHAIEVIDGLMNKRTDAVKEAVGEPVSETERVWRYDGFDVTFDGGRVSRIDIDLAKSPDDLIALIGEPAERIEVDGGTEWRYDRPLLESIFTLFGFQTDKRFLERDGKLYVVIR